MKRIYPTEKAIEECREKVKRYNTKKDSLITYCNGTLKDRVKESRLRGV